MNNTLVDKLKELSSAHLKIDLEYDAIKHFRMQLQADLETSNPTTPRTFGDIAVTTKAEKELACQRLLNRMTDLDTEFDHLNEQLQNATHAPGFVQLCKEVATPVGHPEREELLKTLARTGHDAAIDRANAALRLVAMQAPQ